MLTPAIKFENDVLFIIDQTQIPQKMEYVALNNLPDAVNAIKKLMVRGAPAIGITAAYMIYVLAKSNFSLKFDELRSLLQVSKNELFQARPTAVNLHWALERMEKIFSSSDSKDQLLTRLKSEAVSIHNEDQNACRDMGEAGNALITEGMNILTHCNTGSLATGGWGTALGVVYAAAESGKKVHVYVDETRPLGQGGRLTFWELQQNGVPATLIVDSAAASLMRAGKIDIVLFGSDRITRKGDVANKIGSYSIAALAKMHNIPVYAVAPTSTFDLSIYDGNDIPIEERSANEILAVHGYPAEQVLSQNVYNPAFDVTPAEFFTGIITEKGVLEQPLNLSIERHLIL